MCLQGGDTVDRPLWARGMNVKGSEYTEVLGPILFNKFEQERLGRSSGRQYPRNF